jgi:hypothetical protein
MRRAAEDVREEESIARLRAKLILKETRLCVEAASPEEDIGAPPS